MYTFDELLSIVSKLYGPDGCPWDSVQTYESLIPCLKSEAEEVVEAVEHQDMENLCEELGDVLYQVLLYSEIARKRGDFTLEHVVDGIAKKMVRRHPNVFGNVKAATPEESLAIWNEIKRQEKQEKAKKP